MQKSITEVLQDGLLSGLAGYALISIYFAVSNVVAGLPALHTIDALGTALFGGANPGRMIAYNGLHLAVFIVLGVIAAVLIREVELHPAFWYVLLFVGIAGFIFSYVVMTVVARQIAGLDAYSVVVGNLVAAVGVALVLLWRHPKMVRAVREFTAEDDKEYNPVT
jgi:hypothetical protein